jgi:hypothetical protein
MPMTRETSTRPIRGVITHQNEASVQCRLRKNVDSSSVKRSSSSKIPPDSSNSSINLIELLEAKERPLDAPRRKDSESIKDSGV